MVRPMHLNRNRRGALEGLPLYLIILVIVAAVVIVILLGWLYSINKPSFKDATYEVSGTYQTIDGTSAKIYAPQGGECLVQVPNPNLPGSPKALTVDTFDSNSHSLNGVIVTVSSGSGVLNVNATPDMSEQSGATGFNTGEVTFSTLQFSMAPNTITGTIELAFQYSGGTAPASSTLLITVSTNSGC